MNRSPAQLVLSLGLEELDVNTGPSSAANGSSHSEETVECARKPVVPRLNNHLTRDPKTTHIFMVGGGIASLVAAVHLIRDASVPASSIHLLEASSKPGGALNSQNNGEKGYSIRGARKLNFTYHCLYDTLAKVPSGKDGRTILQEIRSFNKYFTHKTENPGRLVGNSGTGPVLIDATKLNLEADDKVKLLELLLQDEDKMGNKEIQHIFNPSFFESNFWDLWSTMYTFHPWHSAKEFRRYLHRFLHEFPNLQSLSGTERTPMNDYESIIMPIEKFLKDSGVDIRYGTKVKSVEFDSESGDEIVVSRLQIETNDDAMNHRVDVRPEDIVLLTLGSVAAGYRVGTDSEPPPPVPPQVEITENPGPAWHLWTDLANPELNRHAKAFGRPKEFYSRVDKSSWLSFTTTLRNKDFIERLASFTGVEQRSYPLITLRDSPWMICITVPTQPYFLGQPKDVTVISGYGLFPDQIGLYTRKPMTKCSGKEIFEEVLGHFRFPLSPTIEQSTTIPIFMPFVAAPLMTRRDGDRPQVVPEKSLNIGLMGQFVEMERDVAFTMEYSARSAQTAVYTLMGMNKFPHEVYRSDHSVKVLGEALKAIMS